jgi:5-methylcytosine-specific restriction enzyme subunit McrC
MLCYYTGILPEKHIVNVEEIDKTNLLELFSTVFVNALNVHIKKGFYKEYIPVEESTGSIRGKLLFAESIKRTTLLRAQLYCGYDEFTHNIKHNQIIKTTIHHLLSNKKVKKQTKQDLFKIARFYHDIDFITLDSQLFTNIKIHRNNRYYAFLLSICRIIFDNTLIDENEGSYKFRDFEKDEKRMAELFEGFVRNFYKMEQKSFKVFQQTLEWDVQETIAGNEKLIPKMQTDICLLSRDKKIIMDTKYYKQAFSKNYLGEDKINPENLYQLYSYLSNSREELETEGVLLYPRVDKDIDLCYKINGYHIKIKTINLNQNWKGIRDQLLAVLEPT